MEIRLLGTLKSPDVECRTSWFSTGNNLRIVGDLNRRTLTARMDTNVERPELRTFRGNPVATVMRERGRYIAACLTIVRAYVAAGGPAGSRRSLLMAPGRTWCARRWSGSARTILSRPCSRCARTIRRSNSGAWCGPHGPTPARNTPPPTSSSSQRQSRTTQSYATTERGKELREALLAVAASKGGGIDPTRLGNWLRDNQDRQSSGREARARQGKDRTNKALWAFRTYAEKLE